MFKLSRIKQDAILVALNGLSVLFLDYSKEKRDPFMN